MVGERRCRGIPLERGGAVGDAGGVEPALVQAGGDGGALGLGQGVGAGAGGRRVGGAGQRVANLDALGERRGELGALAVEPGEVVAQRGGLVVGDAPAAVLSSACRSRWRSWRGPPRSGRRSRRGAGRR